MDVMLEHGTFSEPTAAFVLREILCGVEYIHSRGVVHRDLKPDNVLLLDKDDIFQGLRIADFGVVHLFPQFDQSLEQLHEGLTVEEEAIIKRAQKIAAGENTGTLEYMAPEMLLHCEYDYAVDMWACGVILFNLLSGSYPFSGESVLDTARLITKAELDLSHPGWGSISLEAKGLLASLVCADVGVRLTATQALQHPWLKVGCRLSLGRRKSGSKNPEC